MPSAIDCPVCLGPAEADDRLGDYETVSCEHCGQFRISETAIALAKARSFGERLNMLHVARRRVLGPGDLPFVVS
jgi:hypothetical protein